MTVQFADTVLGSIDDQDGVHWRRVIAVCQSKWSLLRRRHTRQDTHLAGRCHFTCSTTCWCWNTCQRQGLGLV